MQIRWTKKALRDFEQAVQYIANNDPAAAQTVAQKIWKDTQLLKRHPGLGGPGRIETTRELVIPKLPFIIPYTEKNGIISILRILHASRRWPESF